MKIYTKSEEVLCDTLTPISAFLSLRDQFANVSLFESSDYHSRENSKSYICVQPIVTIQLLQEKLEVRVGEKLTSIQDDVNAEDVDRAMKSFDFEAKDTYANNGFFGVIGYDAIPLFEDIKFKNSTEDLPKLFLAAFKFVLEFDHFHNRLLLLNNSFEVDENELGKVISCLNKKVEPSNFFQCSDRITSSETDDSFKEKVEQAKGHVAKGDVFQLVLSRKFSQEFVGDDFEVYRQLRTINPSPYLFYFDMNKAKLIGASPEAQLKIQKGKAEIHPIAGTVKRSENEIENANGIQHLISDEKENAEHIMLVDLARNDLNQSCRDVEVKELKQVQKFSHVIHLVSKVVGTMTDSTALKTFGGSFPAGTLSGAPKYKAMELIDQFEDKPRGYYGGAIGLFSANGDVNTAIIIRTVLSNNNKLTYQAGAGIVLDSTAEGEWQEVYNKVRSVQTAIKKANQ